MNQASVGFQCPECVRSGVRRSPNYTPRTLPGDRPVVSYVLIGLNVLAFLAQVVTLRSGENLTFGMLGEFGEAGILVGPDVAAGEWWRLVSGGFLHAGLLHIGMNMYVLYAIGPQLERLLGPLRFLGLYFAALLAGSLGVMLVSPTDPTLGASGAIFGLLGAAAAYQVANGINLRDSGLGMLILINLVITFAFSGYVSVGGHVGGLIGGGAVGFGLFQLEQRRVPSIVGAVLALGVALAFAAVSVAIAPSFA
jgi:membrane associated rhomboid family serine protease